MRLPAVKGHGDGVALSLEGALPLHVSKDWVLEPQAQLTFQTFGKISTNDIGGPVSFDNTSSLIGRVGPCARREPGCVMMTTSSHCSLPAGCDSTWTTSSWASRAPLSTHRTGRWSSRPTWAATGANSRPALLTRSGQDAALFGSAGYQENFDGNIHAWDLEAARG